MKKKTNNNQENKKNFFDNTEQKDSIENITYQNGDLEITVNANQGDAVGYINSENVFNVDEVKLDDLINYKDNLNTGNQTVTFNNVMPGKYLIIYFENIFGAIVYKDSILYTINEQYEKPTIDNVIVNENEIIVEYSGSYSSNDCISIYQKCKGPLNYSNISQTKYIENNDGRLTFNKFPPGEYIVYFLRKVIQDGVFYYNSYDTYTFTISEVPKINNVIVNGNDIIVEYISSNNSNDCISIYQKCKGPLNYSSIQTKNILNNNGRLSFDKLNPGDYVVYYLKKKEYDNIMYYYAYDNYNFTVNNEDLQIKKTKKISLKDKLKKIFKK